MKKELAGSQSTDWDSSSLGHGASPSLSPVVSVTIPLVNISLSLTFYCTLEDFLVC